MTVSGAGGGGAVTVGGTVGVGAGSGNEQFDALAGELPFTGSPTEMLVFLSLLLVLAGVMLLSWDRRHRSPV